MLKKIRFIWVLVMTVNGFSQNNQTYVNDQYSGINSAGFSPNQPYFNPNPWDINLISEDVFLQNDYAYISKKSILGLPHTTIYIADPSVNYTGETQSGVFDYYNKNSANLSFASDALGPSASVSVNIKDKKYVMGIFTRNRMQISVIDFDNYLRFGNQSVSQPDFYQMQPFKTSMMNWAEVGFNLSTTIFPYAQKMWVIGASLKYEIGLDAFNINSPRAFELTSAASSDTSNDRRDIYASDYSLYASYSSNYNFDEKKYHLRQNGRGLGLDLGISVVDKSLREEEYNSKWTFNITDIGFVDFTDGKNHHFQGNTVWLQNNPVIENTKFKNPEQFLQLFSNLVYGNATASFMGNGFRIGLPTAVNLNYSQKIKDHHFLNFNWIQRIPVFENSLKRNNLLNVNYSVQKNAIGYGISSSLSEYNNIQFGGYFRLESVILGSENFFPVLFKQRHLHAASVYIGIKLYPFWDDELKRHRRQKCECGQ